MKLRYVSFLPKLYRNVPLLYPYCPPLIEEVSHGYTDPMYLQEWDEIIRKEMSKMRGKPERQKKNL